MKNATGGEIKQTKDTEYQKRYLAHQTHPGSKRDELIQLMKERHSNRRFDDKAIDEAILSKITDVARYCPSSCDRFGVRIKVVRDRDSKALLNGLLVGGVGFVYRAPVVLMLFADPSAYVGGDNGDEIEYNSYIDAGVIVQQIMLAATASELHSVFINPQIRKNNRAFFYERFKPKEWEDAQFCGAICLGYPHKDPIEKTRRLIDTVVVE